MKILVVGLDCAAPEILFTDDRLVNIRRVMDAGCYGKLESVIPPITIPAWMCMATSQDPGSLGVYGFRNRSDRSYGALEIATSRSIKDLTIWDQIAMEGGRSVLIGVPPSFPPRKVNGICVGCMLTPDTTQDVYTHPASVKDEITAFVGEYPVDVKGFRTDDKEWLKDSIYEMTRKHFEVVRHFVKKAEWDYFEFVEIGVDRIHHGFWKHHDPLHKQFESGNPYESVIRDYYRYVDRELGTVFELLDEDTIVLILSDHGARALDGGFCVNEWLVRNGLLVLNERPTKVTPFGELDIDWNRTKVWSEGGYYGRIFLNVKGREPQGLIDPDDYESVRHELQEKLEALLDDTGKSMGTRVFRPDEIYQDVRNIAPDLLVHFGDLAWRAIGGVGYPSVYVQENDTGPDDCNHAQFGAFVLASSNSPIQGEIDGAHLLDLAPTLLELAGYDTPPSMQGSSLVQGKGRPKPPDTGLSAEGEKEVKRRLSGLGYIS
jgi:predicted AlkP superfamily phosphohydrolase/phosphomutase